MEDVIVYLVIAASIVASIYNNYKKQKKANEERNLGKPAPNASSTPAAQTSSPVVRTKPNAQPAPVTVRQKNEKSEIEEALEKYKYEFGKYESLEYADESIIPIDMGHFETHEGFEEEPSIEEQEREESKGTRKNVFSPFETKDDLKKAVLYKEILERKY